PAGARLCLADEESALGVVFVCPGGGVGPRGIHPRCAELVEQLAVRGSWADRADDLRAAPSEGHALTLARAVEPAEERPGPAPPRASLQLQLTFAKRARGARNAWKRDESQRAARGNAAQPG